MTTTTGANGNGAGCDICDISDMSFASKLHVQQGLHNNIIKGLTVHVVVFDVCPGCLESPYFNGWKLIFGGREVSPHNCDSVM